MTAIKEKESVDFKSLRYVEVSWLDAVAGNSWASIRDDDSLAKCISRGWVMKEDDKMILLCGTVGFDEDGLVSEANNTMAIPKGMVQSIVDFPFKARRRHKVTQPKHDTTGCLVLEGD